MKKYISAILMAVMVAVSVPMLAGTATAQRRDRCQTNNNNGGYSRANNRRSSRNYYNERDDRDGYYGNDGYYQNDDRYDQNYGSNRPNVYSRHRKAINIGVATGAGAIIGALVGGKKGAIIGAAAGVAGGAIVTAKQRSRNNGRYNY